MTSADCTPGERARLQAGYSLEAVARKMNLSVRYLRQIERHGQASLKTARRLARLYNCSGNLFLHSPAYLAQLGQGMATGPSHAYATDGADTRKSSGANRRYRPPRAPVLTVIPSRESSS